MNKLTAEVARQDLSHLKSWVETCGISMKEERYMQALEIALPILEQQESVKKVSLREGIEAMRKSIADCGGYDFEALSEQQERGEGDWIEWGGGNCPILRERLVLVKLRGGQTVGPTNAKLFNWHHGIATKKEMSSDIIAYRIIPERASNQNGEAS